MRHYYKIALTFHYFLFLITVTGFSQKPVGIPFIKNYFPKEYGSSSDNWAIAQDQRGVMYFGNASGILQYDGLSWKLIPVSNNSLVRSLAIDDKGIVYVGAVGDFGFLSPDKNGALKYHSLLNKLPAGEKDFADVWKTYVTPSGIYFQTFTKLIRINKNSVNIWKPETSFHFSFLVNNELFINDRDKGLMHISGDELNLVNGGGVFSGLRIYSMLPYSGNQIIIATREKGLALMSLNKTSRAVIKFIGAEINTALINDLVYQGIQLNNNRYAYATLQNGILIMDSFGHLEQRLNKKAGLIGDIVNGIFSDNQEDIWIAFDNGISQVEISSPLRFVHDVQGLNGSVWDIIKYKRNLFIATSLGVFTNNGEDFLQVKGITSQTWSLKKITFLKDSFLIASTEAGIYSIDKTNATLIEEGFGYFICQSRLNPRRIFIGMNDGISSLRWENKKWIDEGYFKGIDKEIRSIEEDEKGNLWLGTPFEGLVKIEFIVNRKDNKDSLVTSWNRSYKIHLYDTAHGLPNMKYNIPYNYKNEMVFATDKGIYEFNEQNNAFLHSSLFGKQFQHNQIYRFVPKDSNKIWMFNVLPSGKKETGVAILDLNNKYSWYTKPFERINESEIHSIYPDESGITWLGGPDGLFRYDSKIKKDFSKSFHSLIREVRINNDSLLFGGNFYSYKQGSLNITEEQPDLLKPHISYTYNALTFEYSASSFGAEKNNLFNVYLQGFDKEWSGWSNKTLKEYTSLKEGHYTFHVRAKNIYGTESSESTYSFVILPPWYRTILAYIIYVIVLILFIYLMVQLSVRRLKAAKTQLEKTVSERTAEVVKQKELIEHQKQIVESKNKDITDSINYAQRIQRSLLASDSLIKIHLSDYFVFFQPKDIVSGDFYWASELADGKFAFVTADSTGHGVPGAIMSMLNISCLNEAVKGNKLTAPDEILNYTRKRIIEHLSNDGSAEGGKDGMDCSLICYDFTNNQLAVASANNPVWIIRNKSIIELEPDKMPVGKHDKDNISFSKKIFTLSKNDIIYSLTDGMPDQFGGPKGKKFMYKQLKELLIEICEKPMNEQKSILRETINNWKGELEQVDDICLVGVRIV